MPEERYEELAKELRKALDCFAATLTATTKAITEIQVSQARLEVKLESFRDSLLGTEGDPGRVVKLEREAEKNKTFRDRTIGVLIFVCTGFGIGHKLNWW